MRAVFASADGYVFDNLAWGGIWDVDPSDVAAPTLLRYGERPTAPLPRTDDGTPTGSQART